MTKRQTLIVVIIAVVVAHYPLSAQGDTAAIAVMGAYTKQIDSWANDDLPRQGVAKDIVEGPMNVTITTTSLNKRTHQLDTSISDIKRGGWGKYTLRNLSGDTLYRVLYHNNIDKNLYLTFYYKDNRLVDAISLYKEGNDYLQEFLARK